MKTCTKCDTPRDLEFFSADTKRPDGKQLHCKICAKEYRKRNKNSIFKQRQEYRKNHSKSIREKKAVDYQKNKEKLRPKRLEYMNNRNRTNVQARLRNNLRRRLGHAMSGNYKKSVAYQYLGCTLSELKEHLEKQFQPGMTWGNYGKTGWHIDHIKALSNFDLTNDNDLKIALHYSNLQPLWAIDNIRKGNRY